MCYMCYWIMTRFSQSPHFSGPPLRRLTSAYVGLHRLTSAYVGLRRLTCFVNPKRHDSLLRCEKNKQRKIERHKRKNKKPWKHEVRTTERMKSGMICEDWMFGYVSEVSSKILGSPSLQHNKGKSEKCIESRFLNQSVLKTIKIDEIPCWYRIVSIHHT